MPTKNWRKQATHTFANVIAYTKKQRIFMGAIACSVLLLASWATWANQSGESQKRSTAAEDTSFTALTKATQSKIDNLISEQEKAKLATADTKGSATQDKPTSGQNVTKYSTSSDPRSTAYSTTPPKRSSQDVEIKITHFGQVAPGTLISYNATKNEKSYYAGDLKVNTQSVTISKSGGYNSATFVVSAPDGQPFGVPSEPWDQHTPGFTVARDSSIPNISASFPLFVSLWDSSLPTGTYTVAFGSGPITHSNPDGWVYMGFIDVIVTD